MSFRGRDDLASIPLFRHVPRGRRRALSRSAVRLEVPAGHMLFDEDSTHATDAFRETRLFWDDVANGSV